MSQVVSSPVAAVAHGELSAGQRLALSRGSMRATMLEYSQPAPRATGSSRPAAQLGAKVVAGFKGLPGIVILVESLESWWSQHPLRTVAIVADEAGKAFVKPVAQRNPLGLVAGALLFGALFALSRPWRWLLRPALFIGLVPQIASHIVRRLPVESWMKMLSSMVGVAAPAGGSNRDRRRARAQARASGLPEGSR
ncbi:MAG: hypothetical protein ABI641_16405 [Caldimonas sp.]